MEGILNKILDRLDSMDKRFDSVDKRFDSVDERFNSMGNRLENLERGQHILQSEQSEMRKGLDNLEKNQNIFQSDQSKMQKVQLSLLSEQSEMRKEMAFYYGSLMKKLDETKSELSSDIKHVSNVQKQHQDVLEILNEKQQS
jgi:chromosome segregation ATPase